MNKALKDKIVESLTSILPIALIVLVLSVAFVPLEAGTFVLFLVGVVFLIVGLGCFMLGADMSMLVIGEKIGATMTHSRKIWLIALLSFVIGIIVTIAEPDLQILAEQVPAIAERTPLGNYLLILTVALGVGIFLMIGMLRIVFRIPLHFLLMAFYVVAFVLSIFVSPDFWAVSFDSGGVTTGPMTVPFIMSLGVGVASIRSGKGSKNDSFGLVALSSVGPIIAVLTLGIIFRISDVEYVLEPVGSIEDTRGVFFEYLHGFGDYAQEVAIALAPILAFFILFQVVSRAFRKRQLVRILVGFVYTFVGLTVFLSGANVGFMPVGRAVGQGLASLWGGWLLIPVGMVIGYFVVAAEPAVHVLNKQVERMSDQRFRHDEGAVHRRVRLHRACHDAHFDGHQYHVDPHPRLRARACAHLLYAAALYGYRLRFGRRGERRDGLGVRPSHGDRRVQRARSRRDHDAGVRLRGVRCAHAAHLHPDPRHRLQEQDAFHQTQVPCR